MATLYNNEQQFQEYLNKLDQERETLSEKEKSQKAARRLLQSEREEERKSREIPSDISEEQYKLGTWWQSLPIYSWDDFYSVNPIKYAQDNEHKLAFDCLVQTQRATYYKDYSKKLSFDEYATFVRSVHLIVLWEINSKLAVSELQRMAEIDSQVVMESSTKLEHNLIKMIDFLEHGYLYARSDKSDKKSYNNTSYFLKGRKRGIDYAIKCSAINKMKELLLNCKVNKVIKRKNNGNNGVALF